MWFFVCLALYVGTGVVLEEFEVITEPAYWSAYGWFWGFLMCTAFPKC
jgi:hypothetical protein